MKYSENGLRLTMEFEGCRLESYLDTGEVASIGYGHTNGVKLGQTCTLEMAKEWLAEDVAWGEESIKKMVHVVLTQNQFDALVDFVFNIGSGHFLTSTLLRFLNLGNYERAAKEFERWNEDNGVVVDGLTRRRLAEKKLFLMEDLWH